MPSKKHKKQKTSWFGQVFMLIFLGAIALAGAYYFGSFELRSKMEATALSAIDVPRTNPSTPESLAQLLDTIYDLIPSSDGLIVEGGELGRDPNSHILAGMPRSQRAFGPFQQESYINLFAEANLQTLCIAMRLTDTASGEATDPLNFQPDPRAPRLTEQAMAIGPSSPHPLLPVEALIRQHGARGARDASLATAYAAMNADYAGAIWPKLMNTLGSRYTRRFQELWLYVGPVHNLKSPKLAAESKTPDAFYAIALDLTEDGGLRAIAFLMPAAATEPDLSQYITSIAQIEKVTGLIFLPELDYSVRDTLGEYVSPRLW